MEKIKQSKLEKFQRTALPDSQQIPIKGGTEPKPETKTKTLQKVVDVRGMG